MKTMSIASPDQVATVIRAECADIARTAVNNAFDNPVPAVERIGKGYTAEPALRTAWSRARSAAEREAIAVGEAAQRLVLGLRTAELRQDPFTASTYAQVGNALDGFGQPQRAEQLDKGFDALLEGFIGVAIKAFNEAARTPGKRTRLGFGPLELQLARTVLAGQLPALRRQVEALLLAHVIATTAMSLRSWAAGQRDRVAESGAHVARLSGSERGSFETVLAGTSVVEGRTSAAHFFSQPPTPEVFLRYAAVCLPSLLNADGTPRPAFWRRFGEWLAERRLFAMEDGPDAAERALREFAGAIAAEVFPDGLSIAELYLGSHTPLPVPAWRRRAQPRVSAGAGAAPTYTVTVVEAPEALVNVPEWAGLNGAAIESSDETQRITMAIMASGYTLADLYRGEDQPLEDLLGVALQAASTPVMEDALLEHLPDLLGLFVVQQYPGGDESTADSREDEPAGEPIKAVSADHAAAVRPLDFVPQRVDAVRGSRAAAAAMDAPALEYRPAPWPGLPHVNGPTDGEDEGAERKRPLSA
jgi:hypothetical protein